MKNVMRIGSAVVGLVLCVGASAGDSLVGRVVDAEGRGIEGAQVCAAPLYVSAPGLRKEPVCGTTGSGGAVTLPVSAGAQQVSVRAAHHASIENERIDGSGVAAKPFLWALSPAGAVRVRLADAAGRGVAGAKVVLQDRLRGKSVLASTDAEGSVHVDDLATGYWRIEIEPSEHLRVVRDNVSVEPGALTDLGTLRARAASFVEGRVVDADGAGVAAAAVRIQASSGSKAILRSTTTDDAGQFRVGGLPASLPVDVLMRPKAEFAARSFERVTLPVSARDFAVDRAVKLSGRAVVEDAALPKGSRVVAFLRSGHPAFDANAGQAVAAEVDPATGEFKLEGIAAGGDVEVRLHAPGIGEASTTVTIEAGKDAGPIELRPLGTGFVLRGQVQDRAGRPISGAKLGSAVSGADGRFTIEGLQPENNRIIVMHPQYAPLTQEFPASGAGAAEAIVVLDEGGTVEGTVSDARGRPLVGVRVAGDAPGLYVTTGARGRYRIEHVPSGEVGIERQSSGVGGDVERRQVTVAAGESRTVDFRMPSGILEGAVTRGGAPVEGAALSVRQSSESQAKGRRPAELVQQSTASDDEGEYRVVGLRPGAATLVVTDGKQSATLPATIAQDGASRLDVELPPFTLAGVVLDASGAPVAGAFVASELSAGRSAKGENAEAYTRTSTDGNGRFLLYTEEPDPRSVTLCTCAQGCHDVEVDAGAGGSVTLWFAPVGSKPEGEAAKPKR